MDRIQAAANLIISINKFHNGNLDDSELIKEACLYFDLIKNTKITCADLSFLKYVSTRIGIPHYFDMLKKYNLQEAELQYNTSSTSSILYECTLHTGEFTMIHKYQKQILDLFDHNKQNRFFLSASTSFGKTYLVYEILKKMKYRNIVLIFPTIALLSENLSRILSDETFSDIANRFSIHTLSEVKQVSDNNLFIFTPERFLSYLEKSDQNVQFDFIFIDEIYKIDNDYLIDDEVSENERDTAYRLALYYAQRLSNDMLLAGPFIDFSKPESEQYNPSFDLFLKTNHISLLNYNKYEIVAKQLFNIKSQREITIDGNILSFSSNSKEQRLIELLQYPLLKNNNTIIYCSSKNLVESYALKLIGINKSTNTGNKYFDNFVNHIEKTFDKNWVVALALRAGIGIHHSLIPKYIQKEIVSLFNNSIINILIATTTITEGVNTSAKNLIVLHDKKGEKPLKRFDALNISGRAGRFLYHYQGNVFILKNDFNKIIDSEPTELRHKNYDVNSKKSDIDIFFTDPLFLNTQDVLKIDSFKRDQKDRNLPDFLFEQYKIISRSDKLTLFDEIKKIIPSDQDSIRSLIQQINFRMNIDLYGFQVVLDTIKPIIKNEKLLFLSTNMNDNEYSSLTYLVHYYLQDGFIGSVRYKIDHGNTIDKAIRDTSDFVYNLLKYQLVKYLGVFNIMYKYFISQTTSQNYDSVIGLDRLLVKLEYNAVSENARIASDFGVPNKIIDYYDTKTNQKEIYSTFDEYEINTFKNIDKIISKSNQ